jgi:hypothetical protein
MGGRRVLQQRHRLALSRHHVVRLDAIEISLALDPRHLDFDTTLDGEPCEKHRKRSDRHRRLSACTLTRASAFAIRNADRSKGPFLVDPGFSE